MEKQNVRAGSEDSFRDWWVHHYPGRLSLEEVREIRDRCLRNYREKQNVQG